MKDLQKEKIKTYNDLVNEMLEEAEEYGYLHNPLCSCMMESPDACDCHELEQIKQLVKTAMDRVNNHWIKMAKAHRPYCSKDGNKDLTRMMGKKNIHKKLSIEEIYEKLRYAHQEIKDIVYMDNFEQLTEEQKNSIEAIHSVMYMTEHYFTDF